MSKSTIIHKDKFGREFEVGSVVVASIGTREIDVCIVTKQSPKMVTVKRVGSGCFAILRYPEELIIINDIPETSLYLFTK